MLNTTNYFQKVSNIDWDIVPEALAKGHRLVEGASQENWSPYRTNENIKRVVDAYFKKLDEYMVQNPVKPNAVKKAPVKTATSKPVKKVSTPVKKAAPVVTYKTDNVEHLDTDVQFIKRYAAMHGKVKSQAQILTLIHSLQKAILERRIRKTSNYAKEIETMQQQLISCYEQMGEMAEIKIDSKNLKRYLEIAHSQAGMLSISLLKAYVSLNGKRDIKDKAERLFNRIKKAVEQGKITKSDKYATKLDDAFQTLKTYIDGDSKILNINKAQLNGLMGIVGGELFPMNKGVSGMDDNGMIVNSGELLKMDFQTIGLQGKYRELIGDPSVGFFAMVFGLPKSGKSTMCLDFANHLAANHGKVLYCAIEEGFGYTLKEKIERLKANHPNLYVTDRVPEHLDQFQFVFIDSVSKAGLEVSDMDEMRKMNPNTSFIFIYHTTKEGKFRGVNAHAHEVDVIIEVEKGKATSTGRFNAGGSVGV
ncbi:MAG: hypothetical protein RLZZ585_1989 [Bacteroidota bacterium]|jgi:hypothetical protein